MIASRRVAGLGAVFACAAFALSGCSSTSATAPAPTTVYITPPPMTSTAVPVTTPVSPTPVTPTLTGKPVRVSSLQDDGQTFGVGMPLVVRFSTSPTDKDAFQKAAKVTVNGRAIEGAWFWEYVLKGEPLEAHFRPRHYWAAHSKIHVALPLKGLSAGKGLSFANDLTLDYGIGAYHVSRVDASTLRMTVYSEGKAVKVMKVSLGKKIHPTQSGVKVVMEIKRIQHMGGQGYSVNVPWSVRVTQDGEFVHAASWNHAIGEVSSSHGCTNLSIVDATWFYHFSQVGDVVEYPNTDGAPMPTWDGLGDWNPSWPTWQAGGAL